MSSAFLIAVTVLFAAQAIRARRLITSALWLAGVSALSSVVFYLYGAHQVAVIELSVGAGLVTVLFVFAISIAGEDAISAQSLLPRPLAWGLVILAGLLLGWFALRTPTPSVNPSHVEPTLVNLLWEQRGLDVLVQVVLIFSGVLGLLGLLAEAKAPLRGAAAEEVAARRERELQALEEKTLAKEKELA